MKKFWFKNKDYGWGWVPASREGWLVLLVYVAGIIGAAFLFDWKTEQSIYRFVGIELLLTAALIVICYKTGEKPEWRWGKKNLPPTPPQNQ